MSLDLTIIEPVLRAQAVESLDAGDVLGFLISAPGNTRCLELVARNASELLDRGLYEAALLDAFGSTRTNNKRTGKPVASNAARQRRSSSSIEIVPRPNAFRPRKKHSHRPSGCVTRLSP